MKVYILFFSVLMLPLCSLAATSNNNAAGTRCNRYGHVVEPLRDPNGKKVIEYARSYIKEHRNLFPGTLKRLFFFDQKILQARYEQLVKEGFLRPNQVVLNHMEFTACAATKDEQIPWEVPLKHLIFAIKQYDEKLTAEKETGSNEGMWTFVWFDHEDNFEQTVALSKTRRANAGYFDKELEDQEYFEWKVQQPLVASRLFDDK
jgi:hypothetical protein